MVTSLDIVRANPESLNGYLQAAQRWCRLNHPNVVAVYDTNSEFQLTEAMQGVCLRDFLNIPNDRRAFSRQLEAMFLPQLVSGLSYAHQHGVWHHFLSPDSIWLFPSDCLKIWGFGTAFVEASHRIDPFFSLPQGFYYLAPEQARGEEADQRADIWAVGVLIYFMASGTLPWTASSLPDLVGQILTLEPPPLVGVMSEALASAVHRCLAKNPADRFQDLHNFRRALTTPAPVECQALGRSEEAEAYLARSHEMGPDSPLEPPIEDPNF